MHEKGDNLNSFQTWLNEEPSFLNQKILKLLIAILPFITISSLLFGIFTNIYIFAELLFTIQFIIVLLYVKRINRIHEKLGNKFELLHAYSELMKLIESKPFESVLLLNAQEKLCRAEANASLEMKKLSKIFNRLERRLNLLVAFFSQHIIHGRH